MRKYLLEITLQSDMCVSDGGVYNSSIDIDICHDANGFPYIPAKRIRGCLRECAIELRDWGMEIPWEEMFGRKGDHAKRAAIRISDAYLAGFREMDKLAKKNSGKVVFHPQNVLHHFTYTRTQTAINDETGAADTTSLRTMRVAARGTVFIAEVSMEPSYQKSLETCCEVFCNIGISRTRGLGEIRVMLRPANHREEEKGHAAYQKGAEILRYQLQLEEPVICKTVDGQEARTLDYIEGSKMQGLLLEYADSREEIVRMIGNGELFCSNAYISIDDVRGTEVPAYIYAVKNDEEHYVNGLYPEPACVKEEHLLLNRMKHCYVYIDEQQKLHSKKVRIEERYHHRRPEDKGIGRASEEENGDSQFYQMPSMEAGQTFQGYFAGTADQIQTIYNLLSRREIYYIGYSRTSEYGRVRLRITGMEKKSPSIRKKTREFYIKLEAPAIVYNKNAFYSTNANDLIDEVNAVLGISRDVGANITKYIQYVVLGGYNITWKCPKPVIVAFEKGTVLYYSLPQEIELTVPQVFFVGERVTEGYGEATIHFMDAAKRVQELLKVSDDWAESPEGRVDAGESKFTYALCRDLFQDYVQMNAAQDAKRSGFGLEMRPTVSNMLLMCYENKEFEQVKNVCHERYEKNTDDKEKKLSYADKILERAEQGAENIVGNFALQYRIDHFTVEDNTVKMLYLDSFLKQMKYNFRQADKEKGGGENEQ